MRQKSSLFNTLILAVLPLQQILISKLELPECYLQVNTKLTLFKTNETTVRDEEGVLEAVEHAHEMLDKEVAAGTSPRNIFVCGLSQGGALAIASVLLYPKTLGGCAVFSGSVPLTKSFADRVTPKARKTQVLWFHGMADGVVLFQAGHAGCAFLQVLGMACEFKTYLTRMREARSSAAASSVSSSSRSNRSSRLRLLAASGSADETTSRLASLALLFLPVYELNSRDEEELSMAGRRSLLLFRFLRWVGVAG